MNYIIDFETLDVVPSTVVINLALLKFDPDRFLREPYLYQELLNNCCYIKFNVEEQVKKYHRTLNKDTLKWWNDQNTIIKAQVLPSNKDVSIDTLNRFLMDNIDFTSYKNLFSRGTDFDPLILKSVLESCGRKLPVHWGSIRDTRSFIEGMSFGFPIKNDFIPPGLESVFMKHDPRHDVAIDVMRMQTVARTIFNQ